MCSYATSGLHITRPRQKCNPLVALLVLPPLIPNPTRRVTPTRVPVRPMHHAALPIPLVLADKLDRRPGPQPVDSRREIEVVRDQHCLTRRQTNNEPLVPYALGIVPQHLRNDPAAADFDAALVIAIRGSK